MTDRHEEDVDRELGEVLDELITAVLETKQAVWSSPTGPVHLALEDLRRALVVHTGEVADAEERIGGRARGIMSPSARRPPNLSAQAGRDPAAVVRLLSEHLGAVASDVRGRIERIGDGPERRILQNLADDLECHVGALATAAEKHPGAG